MAQGEEQGPKLVWTFPLITRFQGGNGLLGTGLQIVSQRMQQRRQQRQEDFSSTNDSADASDDESSDELDQIEDTIGELEESGESVFDTSQDTVSITITENGFEPEEASIDIGDQVEWINETDNSVKLSGDGFRTSIIDPGQSETETFYSATTVTYRDTTGNVGHEGAVTVGDSSLDVDLEPVPLESDTNTQADSMSEAASKKDKMDKGF